MAGLVGYGSSDEDDSLDDGSAEVKTLDQSVAQSQNGDQADADTNGKVTLAGGVGPEPDAPLIGPSLGPVAEMREENQSQEGHVMAPLSPYSSNRALLRDLTLPTVPNYNIPPSPPGSPMESTNAKFKHFLELKKQGIHFNDKLSKSSAMKNPALMQKLLDFSDINEAGQYSTTLPHELWNPTAYPDYAYKEELAKSQQKILKKKEDEKSRGQRESIDFVHASTSSESISRVGTLGFGGRSSQKSTAERVMAGLDKGKLGSPQIHGLKRKSRFDS